MSATALNLLQKYDVPTPRYTSYPTVPDWNIDSIDARSWAQSMVNTFVRSNGELCIYIHLPFCEQLCTFCACTKRITKNHAVESPYLEAVLKEWGMIRKLLPFTPVIKEIHLGGGTPTFFSAANLVRLVSAIKADATIPAQHEFSIEVHPNFTTEEHLHQLALAGFTRISIGVQDFDLTVQTAINRIQTYERTKDVVDWARKYGYNSINIDLVYGLPHQTIASVDYTVRMIKLLAPHRIAFYSYAHVPWKSKGQRRYTTDDLPSAEQKWEMYHHGKKLLMEAGFLPIGMDHFALPDDALFNASAQGKLNRNFMGYTTTQSQLIIGLGASAISDAWNAFAQNEKEVEAYQDSIQNEVFPLVNGHLLTQQDQQVRENIRQLMCNHSTQLDQRTSPGKDLQRMYQRLLLLQQDGLVTLSGNNIQVTTKGQPFIRNICAAIDERLYKNENQRPLHTYSKAV